MPCEPVDGVNPVTVAKSLIKRLQLHAGEVPHL